MYFNVVGVVNGRVILAGDVDLVRIGVVDFTAQAPAALDTESGLESVVVAIGVVFLMRMPPKPS